MKILLILILMLVSFSPKSDEYKNSNNWVESIKNNPLNWAKDLVNNDISYLTNTQEGFNYLVRVFSQKCNSDVLQTLIGKGLNVNVAGEYESLAQLIIMFNHDQVCLDILIKSGLDINITPKGYKSSLLQEAVGFSNKAAIILLCKNKITIEYGSLTHKVTLILAKNNDLSSFLHKQCNGVIQLPDVKKGDT